MSIPGMNDKVKVNARISRRNVLLLNNVIKRGLATTDADKSNNLLMNVPQEALQELDAFAEVFSKSGAYGLSEKLKEFSL